MTLTHPPFYTTPLLTSPFLSILLPFLAPGRCFRTWVLTTYQFFYPSLSLAYRPNERPPSFNFQKARWDGFASHFDYHCPSAEEYWSLFLFSAAALYTSLALNAVKSSIPFGRIKRHPKVWWSAEVESAVSKRRKVFVVAHGSDEDHQAYISASRCASSVITKAEAWQTTCSSLSPKSNPNSVHSLICSIAGSPSWSCSSPNFLNCSSPRESASVYATYLRSHFSVSQPKTLRSRARGYLSELRRATCSVESYSSFCSPFSPAECLAAASNLSPFTATGPDKAAYRVLKHLHRSGMDFLLRIFNLSWSSHFFPSIWKTSSILSIFFFFWKGFTFSDAGSDGTQPASCVDIQNRQSTYSCRCPMYRACQNDVFCGLFCSATLAIRCRSKAPFAHERLKTPNTSPQAVEPDP